jgi:hypothetical protein
LIAKYPYCRNNFFTIFLDVLHVTRNKLHPGAGWSSGLSAERSLADEDGRIKGSSWGDVIYQGTVLKGGVPDGHRMQELLKKIQPG